MKPIIAVTTGDPSGIGPEIVSACCSSKRIKLICTPVVMGHQSKSFGKALKSSGKQALNAVTEAVRLCLNGKADALVTAPVSKKACSMVDPSFTGHTELLARLTGSTLPIMMMQAHACRIVMITRHAALKDVAKQLSVKSLCSVVETACKELIYRYHLPLKKLVMSALNPHAGESGNIGKEEVRIIMPALRILRKKGYVIDGPLPADVCMKKLVDGVYDLGFGLYHDQVMIPLKVRYPRATVNVTLGLPFIRTSPAHGVAYDIAGKNTADSRPMEEAIRLAVEMVRLQRHS